VALLGSAVEQPARRNAHTTDDQVNGSGRERPEQDPAQIRVRFPVRNVSASI
jgi:hypothetical protein